MTADTIACSTANAPKSLPLILELGRSASASELSAGPAPPPNEAKQLQMRKDGAPEDSRMPR